MSTPLDIVTAASELADLPPAVVLAVAFPDEYIPDDLDAEGCLVNAWLTDELLDSVWDVIGRITAVRLTGGA